MKDDRSFEVEVAIECNTGVRPTQQLLERSLAFLDRQRPHVHGIELEKIEGAQRCQMVIVPVADQIEHREPFVVADDDFTVDQTGSHRKRCYGGGCKGEAIPEVISVARNIGTDSRRGFLGVCLVPNGTFVAQHDEPRDYSVPFTRLY